MQERNEATKIEALLKSEFAGETLRHFMQVKQPPVAMPRQLAAAIPWLVSDGAAKVSGVISASEGSRAAV